MADDHLLQLFRVCHSVLMDMVQMDWSPEARANTSSDEYSTFLLLNNLFMYRRLSSPCRWAYIDESFGKTLWKLSEIIWEGVENLI